MRIKNFSVSNYKSIRSVEGLEFERGINVVVGQNSAGKSALLEVLSLKFESVPHRSILTIPNRGGIPTGESTARVVLSVEKSLLRDFVLSRKAGGFWAVAPVGQHEHQIRGMESLVAWMNEPGEFDLVVALSRYGDVSTVEENPAEQFCFGLYEPQVPQNEGRYAVMRFRLNELSGEPEYIGNVEAGPSQFGWLEFCHFLRDRIYRFFAERVKLGSCSFGTSTVLNNDASNLAEVLNGLQGSPEHYRLFNLTVSSILPQIKWVSVEPRDNQKLEIVVWTIEPGTMRNDLCIPLSSCGTGFGQVLSIIYLVFTSSEPRVILIDEPQTFLHPGAAKKLIEVLRSRFSQHQYIVSTHSASIIVASLPNSITRMTNDGNESVAVQFDIGQIESTKLMLSDLGISPSESFGADRILWVEGATEAVCFPLIIQALTDFDTSGVAFLPVCGVGNFDGKKAKIVFDVYARLSGSEWAVPPAIGFEFDREELDQQMVDRLIGLSGKPVIFLGRRMYENYLLNSRAICAVLSSQIDESQREFPDDDPIEKPTLQLVEEWIERRKDGDRLPNGQWGVKCDAARVLSDLFSEFTQSRIEYRKVTHSTELTKWVLEHAPAELDEIVELLRPLFVA